MLIALIGKNIGKKKKKKAKNQQIKKRVCYYCTLFFFSIMKIPCICIDDSFRPESFPSSKWVVKDRKYHITNVLFHPLQDGGVQGVTLSEINLEDGCCYPYKTFRINRFAMTEEDFLKLVDALKKDKENVEEILREEEIELV